MGPHSDTPSSRAADARRRNAVGFWGLGVLGFWGFGFRVEGLRFRVLSFGFKGLGLKGFGSRVEGFVFRVLVGFPLTGSRLASPVKGTTEF